MPRTLRAFVEFTRPHTIVGTVLAVVSLWLMVGASTARSGVVSSLTPPLGVGDLVLALGAALATNVFIVGINQVADVDIDRINKPWLPLAAGSVSMRTGRIWVAASAVLAIGLGWATGRWMLLAVLIGLAVGAAYSVPPLRLKRLHLAAAISITSVRALVVNLLVWAQFIEIEVLHVRYPAFVLVLTGMVLALTIAIAWFKDIPDAEGDAAHGIGTLVLRVGLRPVLGIGLAILFGAYLAVIGLALGGLEGVSTPVLANGHAALAVAAGAVVLQTDLTDHESLRRFYQRIWYLFFAEYVVFTGAVLLAA